MKKIRNILNEFAYPRSKAEVILNSHANQLALHILKLKFVNDPQNNKHWVHEIWNWLFDCDILLKPENKTPDFNFYYKNLFEYPLSDPNYKMITKLILTIEDQYHIVFLQSSKDIYDFLKEVFVFICGGLENRQFLIESDVINFLKEIL